MKQLLRAIWAYRFFILSSIKNDLRARFTRSKLGGLWMIIHPLTQVLIFALILSEVLSAKLPGVNSKYAYALYLMAGMLFWTLFAETITKCLTLFIDNGNLMKKMAFPRICLPIIAAGTMLVNNILLSLAIFAVFAALGHFPGVQALWLPVLVGLTLLLAMALGIFLGVINVFMRDVGQVVPVILSALFWLTPIVYNLGVLPPRFQFWFGMNPLYVLVTSYQNVLVYEKPPLWSGLTSLTICIVVLSLMAFFVFRKSNAEMVDSL
ncbi:ABC transporter permease [Lysobacter capsici]|uniref:ABC transporter permease n=1 Tax=Lysobacter capsici TaxID=435897 RepID=UPI001C003EDA|nr:ABC transporter permease [Lysobacter capsici]QWF16152.1 ABC transporter permease [Lysobacter capsici]